MKKNLYGIVGYPLEHSLSPVMHNTAFQALGINAVYQKFEVAPENLNNFINNKAREEIAGLSVTIPHKIKVMRCLDEIADVVREIGAVNTIINKNGYLIGANTDWIGVLVPLEKYGDLKGKKVIVLGNGGAARAACYGLKKADANVVILGRNIVRVRKLAARFECFADSLENIGLYAADVLINTTSVGMEANEEPLVPKKFFKKNMIVFDVVYKPLMTKLLREAKRAGCEIITGEKMLLSQGAAQFELWTGKKAPVEVMRIALEGALTNN